MFVALIGMMVCSKKQKTNPNAQPIAMGLLIVVIVCGVAMLYRTGILGDANAGRMAAENQFTASQGIILGQYLAANNPGKVLVIAEADFKTNTYTKTLVEGLKEGMGAGADVVVDTIEIPGAKKPANQDPNMPDAYDYFDRADIGAVWSFPSGGQWSIKNSEYLSQDITIADHDNWFMAIPGVVTEESYTAEFHFRETTRESSSSQLGVIFNYIDESNYGIALFNSSTNQMELNFLANSVWGTEELINLPGNQDFTQWHSVRIEKFNTQYKFFLDNMLLHTTNHQMAPGAIGYITDHCQGDFGYIAFSDKINGSGTFDVYKPIPGKIAAIQFISGGEGIAFHEATPEVQGDIFIRSDENEIIECPLGGYAINTFESNEWYKYNVNVELDRLYNCEIIYATDLSTGKIQVSIDDVVISDIIELPTTGGTDIWRSLLIKDLALTEGFHTLKIEAISGDIKFYSMEFVIADNVSFDKTDAFDGFYSMKWKYNDGDWSIQNNTASINGYGKRAFGSSSWRNYTVETDILFNRSMNAGIIFRVNNPALGGAGNDPILGSDFLQGYFAGFNFSSIVLGKHNFGWESLTSAGGSYSMDTWYHMRVVVVEDNIRIYIDDMNNPVINYTDTDPLINGMAGFRSRNSDVQFDNFRVTSEILTSTIKEEYLLKKNEMKIYPNPASEYIIIAFDNADERKVKMLNINGKELLSTQTSSEQVQIQTNIQEMCSILDADEEVSLVTSWRDSFGSFFVSSSSVAA